MLKDIIKKNLNINEKEILKIDKIIKNQNARPGNTISTKKNVEYIIPDIKVSRENSNWIIIPNKKIAPDIKINKKYIEFSNRNISEEDKDYVKSNLQEAKLFIKNINYRNDTLLKLAKCIFKNQIDFFENGIEELKPMSLKEAALEINVHESTISRLTNGKYIETPYGIFELKFFFSSSIANDLGENLSSQSIKEKIKKIIKSEDKLKPYSDEKIVKILKLDGINIARRTVTKYRESLKFESSSKRKTK